MKIVDDVEFVRKELEKFGFTADDLALRWVGGECVVIRYDDVDGTVLCGFQSGEQEWFPKSCVVDETVTRAETLRDEIAMAALTGLVTRSGVELSTEEIKACYEIADVAMEARKK